jgi:Fic/DOC family
VTSRGSLVAFVRDSNAIEGIHRDPLDREISAHETFLELEELTVPDLERFVDAVAGASLRTLPGMNVVVAPHTPPPGGPKIEAELSELLSSIVDPGIYTAWEIHVEYESLHPFSDGNGRSGRVLWAWQVLREGRDPFVLPVLQRMYYDALDWGRQQ